MNGDAVIVDANLRTMHSKLWVVACDLFGTANLVTMSERLPETWKPPFAVTLVDPVKDRDFLIRHSPRKYFK
jgi:hypothetical protein